jgi:hypothetical protein
MKVNKKINLSQLDKELNNQGLNAVLNDLNEIIEIYLAENNSATNEELKKAIDNHIAIDEKQIKAEAKAALLVRLGITAEEAQLLLS